MWVYNSKTGKLLYSGTTLVIGYSGHSYAVNEPECETIHDLGPIPRGKYTIGESLDHPDLGECSLPLVPHKDTNTFGREGFYAHGDKIDQVGQRVASHGCIILPRYIRELMSNSRDRELLVN